MFRKNKIYEPVLPRTENGHTGERQLDLGEFIADHSDDLVKSADSWRKVGVSMRSFKDDPEVIEKMRDGVAVAFDMANVRSSEVQIDREASRVLGEFTAFMQLVARNDASSGKSGIVGTTKQLGTLAQMIHPNMQGIVNGKNFPKGRYINTFINMRDNIRQADATSDKLLQALCRKYIVGADDVVELANVYAEGGEETRPVLSELRKMIVADWYRIDPSSSILRAHCDRLAQDPSLHVDMFCKEVAEHNKFGHVASMAQYAIMSTGGSDVSGEMIRRHLQSTQANWHKVPDLQEAFNDYISHTGVAIERSFEAIAGVRSVKDVRVEHTDQEVLEAATGLSIWVSLNSKDARMSKRAREAEQRAYRKTYGIVGDTLPGVDELVAQLSTPELLKRRKIKFARPTSGRNFELVDTSEELTAADLMEQFNLNPHQEGIGEDMLAAAEYLKQPSGSYKGVRRLESTDLKVGNKRHGLWRLAPDKAPGLRVRSNNRFYRVIYAIVNGDVVLYDMLSHAEFDKKYPG